jgi:ribonuclease D
MSSLADTDAEVAETVERFCRAPRVALDVEGDGLFRYRAQLCTVQLCAGEDVAVVDTLQTDPTLLSPLVEDAAVTKIVHDASFDVRLLREAGVGFAGLFDTSVAARFLGEPATGLASLLQKHLDVKLKKEKQHSDWGRRPIDQEHLEYLENDVIHLEALAEVLEEAAREKGILEEILTESAWVVTNADGDVVDDRPPWTRIKGALDLVPADQAVLREVALVREKAAEQMNVPPFKVVRNDVLMALARRKPKDHHQALKIRGLDRGRARRLVREMVAAVKRGRKEKAPPNDELPRREPAPPVAERDRKKRLQKGLSRWRKKEAAGRDVDPQVVLPGHCLSEVVARMPKDAEELVAIEGFGEFRVERYGDRILELVRNASK